MASGNIRDAGFARGLIRALSETVAIDPATAGHCRAKAMCGHPLGAVDGDVAIVVQSPMTGGNTLLIVEREGSGPGNERNILKWFHVVRSQSPITIRATYGTIDTPAYDRVELLLAFTRTFRWEQSDFEKTAGFCSLLAELVNRECEQVGLKFTVRVACCPGVIDSDGWERCGEHFGQIIAKRLVSSPGLSQAVV